MSMDKLPKGYFESLPQKLSERILDMADDLGETPNLDRIGKEEPYLVPATYFDQLKARILRACQAGKHKRRIYYLTSLAAVMLLIFSFLLTNWANASEDLADQETIELALLDSEEEELLEYASDEDLELFIEEMVEELDIDELDKILESVI